MSLRICSCVIQTCLSNVKRKRVLEHGYRLFACSKWTNHSSNSLFASTSRTFTTDVIPAPVVEGENKEYPQKVQNLVNEISQLTLMEVADLNELLKKTLNITDTPMMAMGAMSATQAKVEADDEQEETKQEKTSFSVKLMGFDEKKKVVLIKELKSLIQGMNLVQAKKFVESTPQVVRADMGKNEAEELQKALDAAGGKTEIE